MNDIDKGLENKKMIKTYKGIDYIVFIQPRDIMMIRDAYIKIPEDHPWIKFIDQKKWYDIGLSFWKMNKKGPKPKSRRHYDTNYSDIPLDVHGGVTFGKKIKKSEKEWPQDFTPGYWVGWDYLHLGDEMYVTDITKVDPKDLEIWEKIVPGHISSGLFKGDHAWTEEEMEADCKDAIDQLLKAKVEENIKEFRDSFCSPVEEV